MIIHNDSSSTIVKMTIKRTSGCCNVRCLSISLGAVTTILWIIAAYLFIHRRFTESNDIWIKDLQTVMFRTLSSFVTFAVVSVFMTYGAFVKKPDYMFPWVAIHFALLMYFFVNAFAFVLSTISTPNVQRLYISVVIASILGSVMAILWNMVYVYYKRLMTDMQVIQPPLRPNDATTVKDPKSPEHPCHPV